MIAAVNRSRMSICCFNRLTYFYDGFANLVQLKTGIENNQEVVKNLFYDNNFRVSSEQNPYFTDATEGLTNVSLTANKTFYNYDALDRVTSVINPDGSNKTIVFENGGLVNA